MTKEEKLIQKFKQAPQSLSASEVLKIMSSLGIEVIQGKGSHVICKYEKMILIVLPLHNNDCKPFYKKQALKALINHKLL